MIPRAITVALAIWCACLGFGTWKMLDYELTPARTTSVATQWPAASLLDRDSSRPTLVLFLHPHCPCSRASLRELDRLVADCGSQLALRILFVRPSNMGDGWERTDLYRMAEQLPAALVLTDDAGREATRFGATTSGQALLYAADGRLLFHGGLTPSRGHEGDNAGRSAVAAILQTGRSSCITTAVFGCSLVDHSEPSKPWQTDVPIVQTSS